MDKKVVVGFLLLLLVVGLLWWRPWAPRPTTMPQPPVSTATQPPTVTPIPPTATQEPTATPAATQPPTATAQPPTSAPDFQRMINSAVETALAQSTMPAATPIATATSGLVATGLPEAISSNGWEITEIDVQNDPIVAAWLLKVKAPAPDLWPTFPNVPNPLVPGFRVVNGNQVPDGVEYGEGDSPFCEYKQTCDWVVPAWHYRLISGDYKFTSPKFSYSCQNAEGQPRKGCLIVLFNVMNESYTWRDQSVDNGFTVVGRYWNGDQLQWAVWGLTSHAAANMLNLPSMRDPTTGNVLNAGGNSANAGGNCGIQPDACSTVDVMVIIHAGDRILATMHTTVTK